MDILPIIFGKALVFVSRKLNLGHGSTWPGHLALKFNKNFAKVHIKKNPRLKIILVAGTNGKTTTTKFVQEILESTGLKVFRNEAGANLLNGIVSSIITYSNIFGKLKYDVAIFEIDENNLPIVLAHINPFAIVLLNLFRDQLDRYGEVNAIAKKWQEALTGLSKNTLLITNGDDPMLRYIGENSKIHAFYFGLAENLMEKKEASHDVDFLYCPHCQEKLSFSKRSYSHMGIFNCLKCGFTHKKTVTFETLPNPLFGNYNRYNINAAALLLQKGFGVDIKTIEKGIRKFAPAFGRQEKILYKQKKVFLLLSKNPTGFNQSIRAIIEQDKNPIILLLLNDRIPDGRDVSWIWDVEFEELNQSKNITVSGDRAYDMGLRIKYADLKNFEVIDDLKKALDESVAKIKDNQTLYILSTYSAMLDTRKILKGRKIL